jgi:hypothetical protein
MSPTEVTVSLNPGDTLTPTVTWTPTTGGSNCIQVILEDVDGEYRPQRSQRNVDVVERPPCGETQTYTFTVYNDSPITQMVDIGMMTFNVPADWQVEVEPDGAVQLGPYREREITVTVLIPCAADMAAARTAQLIQALQEAAGSVPTIDVEGYIQGELVGGIELQFEPAEESVWLLYMPALSSRWARVDPYAGPCDADNRYCEDHDSYAAAYGPLEPDRIYAAYPDDTDDYYFFDLSDTSIVTIRLRDYQAIGELLLYKLKPDGGLGLITYWGKGGTYMELQKTLPADRYYVRLYAEREHSTRDLYSLTIGY